MLRETARSWWMQKIKEPGVSGEEFESTLEEQKNRFEGINGNDHAEAVSSASSDSMFSSPTKFTILCGIREMQWMTSLALGKHSAR